MNFQRVVFIPDNTNRMGKNPAVIRMVRWSIWNVSRPRYKAGIVLPRAKSFCRGGERVGSHRLTHRGRVTGSGVKVSRTNVGPSFDLKEKSLFTEQLCRRPPPPVIREVCLLEVTLDLWRRDKRLGQAGPFPALSTAPRWMAHVDEHLSTSCVRHHLSREMEIQPLIFINPALF